MSQETIITIEIGKDGRLAFLSDLHWDNPKTNRVLLKKQLDYCVKHKIPVFLNGDTFCLMQGKNDRRGTKSDVLPEHNTIKYFDAVVNTAVEWFAPYAHIIAGVGYGNHETAILKHQETDILERWVQLMNLTHDCNIQLGGYGGWIIVKHRYGKGRSPHSFFVKYFHGSGGGGVVTKGAINLTRAKEMYENFDLFVMSHVHENWGRTDERDSILVSAKAARMIRKQIHLMITGTFKEEYGDGSKGWHVERGAPPKTLGGRIALFQTKRTTIGNIDGLESTVDSMRFPLL